MSESYFGETKKSIGIDRLLLRNVYSAAYPLHEVNTLSCVCIGCFRLDFATSIGNVSLYNTRTLLPEKEPV